jgi:hypothetical protein
LLTGKIIGSVGDGVLPRPLLGPPLSTGVASFGILQPLKAPSSEVLDIAFDVLNLGVEIPRLGWNLRKIVVEC